MKLILLPFAALLALNAQAQLDALPPCAKTCASSLPQQCGIEVSCICKDQAWLGTISCCIIDKCPNVAEQQAVITGAQQICKAGGVTLASTLPPCATATSASSASGTATPTTTTGTRSTSGTAGSASTTPSTNTAQQQTSTSTGTTGTSSPAPQSTGAAVQLLGSNLGAAGAALAAVALF